MSHAASTWAWAQAVASPATKLVLVKLADSANDDGICWPSLRTLEKHLGMGKSSVDRHVKRLVEARLLTVERRSRPDGGHSSSLYTLAVPCPTQAGQGVSHSAGTGLSHPGRDTEPSLEPSEEETPRAVTEPRDGGNGPGFEIPKLRSIA